MHIISLYHHITYLNTQFLVYLFSHFVFTFMLFTSVECRRLVWMRSMVHLLFMYCSSSRKCKTARDCTGAWIFSPVKRTASNSQRNHLKYFNPKIKQHWKVTKRLSGNGAALADCVDLHLTNKAQFYTFYFELLYGSFSKSPMIIYFFFGE